jgi:hypothetical protein
MRALDCSDPAHPDPMHFSAENDADLVEEIKKHRDEWHTQITDQQIQEMVPRRRTTIRDTPQSAGPGPFTQILTAGRAA